MQKTDNDKSINIFQIKNITELSQKPAKSQNKINILGSNDGLKS